MKYDEMLRRFKENGFDLERHECTFFGFSPDVIWFKKNDQGIWEKHQTREKSRGEAVYPYACEEDMVNDILSDVYYKSKWGVERAARGEKVAKVYLDSYTGAMKVFDKGVFRDVLPQSYTKSDRSTGPNWQRLAKAAGLTAIGISAIWALLKKKDQKKAGNSVYRKDRKDWFEVQKKDVIAIVEKKKDRHPWYIDPNASYRCLIYRGSDSGEIFMTVDEFRTGDSGYLCCPTYSTLLCRNIEEYRSLSEDTFVRKAYNTWMNGAHL